MTLDDHKYYNIDDSEISHSKTVRRKGERIAKKKIRRKDKEQIKEDISEKNGEK